MNYKDKEIHNDKSKTAIINLPAIYFRHKRI